MQHEGAQRPMVCRIPAVNWWWHRGDQQ
uniref:Uncharacterized protein n=1 Tax=Arundo donax TaxID=35708 RepID=A0A0A8ZLE8_ARUDO